MKKILASIALLGVAACNEVSSPDTSIVSAQAEYRFAPESPPPPPLDSGTMASTEEYGEQPLNITYFLNRPGNSGWLTFSKNQAAGVTVTNNARVSYSKGMFSGTGTVKYPAGGGIVTLNLAGVSQSSTFNGSDKGYFNLVLNGATHTTDGRTVSLAPVTVKLASTRTGGGGECYVTADVSCGGS